jgi:hypothetical protein
MGDNTVGDYDGVFVAKTDKAILFVPENNVRWSGERAAWDDESAVWLPKSQIAYDDTREYKKGEPISLEIPDWLAEEKELI